MVPRQKVKNTHAKAIETETVLLGETMTTSNNTILKNPRKDQTERSKKRETQIQENEEHNYNIPICGIC